ncbi:MAG: hypothetical protein ABH885_06910 [Candidatus Omnitrophota bacterium]
MGKHIIPLDRASGFTLTGILLASLMLCPFAVAADAQAAKESTLEILDKTTAIRMFAKKHRTEKLPTGSVAQEYGISRWTTKAWVPEIRQAALLQSGGVPDRMIPPARPGGAAAEFTSVPRAPTRPQ